MIFWINKKKKRKKKKRGGISPGRENRTGKIVFHFLMLKSNPFFKIYI